ncbi:CHAT domain-containing protein [Kitasatospora purpeofusca]|uniref:CHAT domain-containing protein n=1 Tax=Kitasatospora purpeofusca TaxID=67352 RepID=UPI002259B615|nr:CHAT domain-containing protein [Kitasatospora purpeofusca]MCX4689733.1 CHAT domain-containing protein [Kitasatospora purpeofusca]
MPDQHAPAWLPPRTALIRIGTPAADGSGHPTLLALGGGDPSGAVHHGRPLPDGFLDQNQLRACRELFDPDTPMSEAVRTAGGLLGDALLAADLLDPWFDAIRKCHADGHPAHTLLDIRCPRLRTLPWELVAAPGDPVPLCIGVGPGLTFARLLRPASALLNTRLDPLHLPLRLLVVIGDTDPRLGAEKEAGRIRARLTEPFGEWHVEVVRTPTSDELASRLADLTPHVLHFIGHQQRDGTGAGVLTVRPPHQEPWDITGATVHGVLTAHVPRLVVLNACDTAGHAAEPLLTGLMSSGVAAVVGMSGGIESGPAGRFAEEFYAALGRAETVDRAVLTARQALLRADLARVDWARPVLVVRDTRDTVLTRLPALRVANETDKRFAHKRWNLRYAVDRVTERRALFDGFAPTGPDAPVTVVTGGPGTGKATLVRSVLHTWYRNGALTLWTDLEEIGRTATWLDLVLKVVDRLGDAAPGHPQLRLLEHRLAQLHTQWATDDKEPLLTLGPDRIWQDFVPGNSVGHLADRRHTALRHLADALLRIGSETGLVLALRSLGALEHLTVRQLLVPHLVEPLAAQAGGRAKVVLVANEEEAELVPFPLSDTARWITLKTFAADDLDAAVGDYGRAHDLSDDEVLRFARIMDLYREQHGGLVPDHLKTGMGTFGKRVGRR